MDRIIDTFNKNISVYDNLANKSMELEIRFQKISFETFRELFTKLSMTEQFVFSESLAIIKNEQKIITIPFIDGVAQSKQYSQKLSFRTKGIFDYYNRSFVPNFKIALSEEISKLSPMRVANNDKIRIKLRASFKLPNSKWIIDFTFTSQLQIPEGNNILQSLLKTMFPEEAMTKEKFINIISSDIPNQLYELEIERTSMTPIQNSEEIMEQIRFIYGLISIDTKYIEKVRSIATLINHWNTKLNTIKHLYPQPKGLTKSTYREIWPPVDFLITNKTDGEHALIYLSDGIADLITNTTIKSFVVPSSPIISKILAEGELLDNKLFLFDVLLFGDDEVYKNSIEVRITYLDRSARIISSIIEAESKRYIQGNDNPLILSEGINSLLEEKKYPIDGIIFVKKNNDWARTEIYKWKPIEKNTIDLLVKIEPSSENIYLFASITWKLYKMINVPVIDEYENIFNFKISDVQRIFPIQFSPSLAPDIYKIDKNNELYDILKPAIDKIVELSYDVEKGKLILHKIRTDRNDFGNNFKVAELTFSNSFAPLTKKELWEGPVSDYFSTAKKSPEFRAQTNYSRTVISKIIDEYCIDKNWIVDLCSGRGADIHRYKCKNLLMVDKDNPALIELITRYYFYLEKQKIRDTRLYVLSTDLSNPYNETLEKINNLTKNNKADVVIINFAIHYFTNGLHAFENLAELISEIIAPNGYLIFTCFSGERVKQLFEGVDEWNSENGKYSIIKKYTDENGLNFGQCISVKHPFSRDQYIDEFLVIKEGINEIFVQKNITLVENRNFLDFDINKSALSTEDKKYISLFDVFIYQSKI